MALWNLYSLELHLVQWKILLIELSGQLGAGGYVHGDDKPVDDGYRSKSMILIHKVQVFELWIETIVYDPYSFQRC